MSDWLNVTGIIKAVGNRMTVVAEREAYFNKLARYVKNAPVAHEIFSGLTFEVTVIDDVANRLDDHAQYASEGQNISLAFNASFRDLDIDDSEKVLNWLNQYFSERKAQSEIDLFIVQGVFNVTSGFDSKTYVYTDSLIGDEQGLNYSWNEL